MLKSEQPKQVLNQLPKVITSQCEIPKTTEAALVGHFSEMQF